MQSTTIQKWVASHPYLDIRGGNLEGPYYTASRNELRFVDIEHDKIYFLNLNHGIGSLRVFATVGPVGVTANFRLDSVLGRYQEKQSHILVAAKHGFATLDSHTGSFEYVCRVYCDAESSVRMRFNDGAVDSRGRFWAGSCNDHRIMAARAEGTLFRLDPDLSVHRMVEKMVCPNGIGWNNADNIMYLTDSALGKIFAYDYIAETGAILNRRDFFTLDARDGSPDGLVMDEEDCIWLAIWEGSRVVRISPRGQVVGEVLLPTRYVTCPEFVGTDLYVCTAREQDPERYPLSARSGGKLYKVDVGVKGTERNVFGKRSHTRILFHRSSAPTSRYRSFI